LGDRYITPTSKLSLLIRGTNHQTDASGVPVVEDFTCTGLKSSFTYKATLLFHVNHYTKYTHLSQGQTPA